MSSQASTVKLANSTSEIEQCFSLISQLRPHLVAADFVRRVEMQMSAGYQLAYISDRVEVVGAAGFNITTNLAWGKHLYIADLVVDKQRRSRGYGEALFNWLIEYAQKQGCQQLHLDSGVQRFAAHRFYLRHKMHISSHHFCLKL